MFLPRPIITILAHFEPLFTAPTWKKVVILRTRNGAIALGLETGVIAPGMLADFVAIELNHAMLAGWNGDDFLDVLFFGASAEVVVGTWVGGRGCGCDEE